MTRLPDTIQEIIAAVKRRGGAVLIARSIAIQQDPQSSPEKILAALHWEAVMREKHGDPKPAWLAKEIERQKVVLAEHREFMAPFRAEARLYGTDPDDRREGSFFSYAQELAIGHCMEETR